MADERSLPILYCSFCGKSQCEVAKLIAGPTVFICDECIDMAAQIVSEERAIAVYKKHLRETGYAIIKVQAPPLTTSLERFEAFHKGPTDA